MHECLSHTADKTPAADQKVELAACKTLASNPSSRLSLLQQCRAHRCTQEYSIRITRSDVFAIAVQALRRNTGPAAASSARDADAAMPRFEFFPNLFMTLINVRFLGHKTRPVQAVFRIAPRMNKLEVKEYLQTIYGLPVKKVMTDNFYGGYRRIQGKRAMFHVSRPNYKRAVVTFERGAVVYKPSD
mgnify:CR=1 FL=1